MAKKYPDPIKDFDFIINRSGKPTYRHERKMIAGEKVPEEVKAALLQEYEKLQAENAREAAIFQAQETTKELREHAEKSPDYHEGYADRAEEVSAVELSNPFEMTPEEQAIIDNYPTTGDIPEKIVGTAIVDKGIRNDELPLTVELQAVTQRLEKAENIIKELLNASVFEADISLLAQQMSERFNVYTVFVGREPLASDIHPITAEVMSSFDKGLAYKQFIRATMNGRLDGFEKTVEQAQNQPRFDSPTRPVQQVAPVNANYKQHEDVGIQSHLNRDKKDAESYGISGVINDPPINRRSTIVDSGWQKKAKSIDQFNIERL